MKKGAIIAAVILLAAGCLIFTGGLFAGGSLPPMTYEAMRYSVTEPFTGIRIDAHEANIELIPSTDEVCSVAGAATEKFYWNVSVQDGVLTVMSVDERTWVDRLMSHADQPLQIRLPQQEYKTLTIDSRTGDIEVADAFLFESVEITASTGDVVCFASATDHMKIKTNTGDIRVEGVLAGALDLAVTTGRVDVSRVVCTGDLTLSVSTGRSTLKDVACKSFATSGSTGDLTMENVIALDMISIKRSAGDVRFTACDAQEITVETGTGDVTGSLRSAMVFTTKTDTGSVDVPPSTDGGPCRITTDTGDIKITIP